MKISDIPLISEVKDEYISLRQNMKSRALATQEVINKYQNELTVGICDDGLLFWIGLAEGQYTLNEITEDVSLRAVSSLEALARRGILIEPKDIIQCKIRYEQAPLEEKKLSHKRKFACTWKIGDTFAYKISNLSQYGNELSQEFAIFRKVDDADFGDGRILPIVTLSLWSKLPLPSSLNEIARIPMLRNGYVKCGIHRNLRYTYRLLMLFTSQSQVKKLSLQYLGNFPHIPSPDDEFIPDCVGEIFMIPPNQIDRKISVCYRLDSAYRGYPGRTGDGSVC